MGDEDEEIRGIPIDTRGCAVYNIIAGKEEARDGV